MATWPASLPQSPLIDDFDEQPPSTTIKSSVEVGPAKSRQRTTAGEGHIKLAFVMDNAQMSTLETFYVSTLAMGSLPFDFTHPRKGTTVSLKMERPKYSPLSHEKWQVDFNAREQP